MDGSRMSVPVFQGDEKFGVSLEGSRVPTVLLGNRELLEGQGKFPTSLGSDPDLGG